MNIKLNIKWIISIIITAILCISTSVFATLKYNADEVRYRKSDNKEINVQDALNELYNNTDLFNKIDWSVSKDKFVSTRTNGGTASITLDKGNYIVFVVETCGTSSSAGTFETFKEVDTPGTLNINEKDGSYELLSRYKGSKSANLKAGTSYFGINSDQSIYKCKLNKQTTISNICEESSFEGYASILTIYAIKID